MCSPVTPACCSRGESIKAMTMRGAFPRTHIQGRPASPPLLRDLDLGTDYYGSGDITGNLRPACRPLIWPCQEGRVGSGTNQYLERERGRCVLSDVKFEHSLPPGNSPPLWGVDALPPNAYSVSLCSHPALQRMVESSGPKRLLSETMVSKGHQSITHRQH